jgi:hypothetical protein
MNEPPGARARVGLTGLTVAEHFRDAEGQDVLLFIDNIFRFTQVISAGVSKKKKSAGHFFCLKMMYRFWSDYLSSSLFEYCVRVKYGVCCALDIRQTPRCLLFLDVSHLLWDTSQPLPLILEDCKSVLRQQRRVLLRLSRLSMCLLMT